MTPRYIHHFECSDGTVTEIRSPYAEPTLRFIEAMANQWYDYIHTTRITD